MSDTLIVRLRDTANDLKHRPVTAELIREAADEIERLRAACLNDAQPAYSKADAEALCEIAVAAVKKSISDYCRSMIIPTYAAGGISVESSNAAFERVIAMLDASTASPEVSVVADARRYRWLRDESWRQPYAPGPLYRALYDGLHGYANADDLKRVWLRYEGALDAAIDAALSAEKGGGKG